MLFPGSKTFIGIYLFNPFIIGKQELTNEKSGSLKCDSWQNLLNVNKLPKSYSQVKTI